MILVYTGDGKGKTTACVGQAIRAHGRGLRVAFGQFMKRPNTSGEQEVLSSLLREGFFAGGRGFFRNGENRSLHRQAALSVLGWANRMLGAVDLLVLDESLYALGSELLMDEELQAIAAAARKNGTHLLFSGRGAPEWLLESADLVTEMRAIKHPFAEGREAEKGIEF